MEKTALIAMSGGVDSSVAAQLMLEAGYRCEGCNMRLYQNGPGQVCTQRSCCSKKDMEDAARVCALLDIPFSTVDLTETFRREVIDKFVRVYEAGGTPNPCVDCNRCLKFSALLDVAREKGLWYVVTGHYVRVEYDRNRARWLLRKAADPGKDQSYFLYMLTQEQLSHVQFPLGGMTKPQVRSLADALGLPVAEKKDSQDVCFIPDGDYGAFLERYTGKTYPPGDFVDETGKVLGRHRGAVKYTIGQRRGLELPMGERVYVNHKDMAANRVTVGPDRSLYTATVWAEEMNWIAISEPVEPIRARARTRYRMAEQPCTVYPEGEGRVRVEFDGPQRAVTPGQAVVLYDGDLVVGGGTILPYPEAVNIN